MRKRFVWLASLAIDNGEIVVSVSMTGIELQNITEEFGCDRRFGCCEGLCASANVVWMSSDITHPESAWMQRIAASKG